MCHDISYIAFTILMAATIVAAAIIGAATMVAFSLYRSKEKEEENEG